MQKQIETHYKAIIQALFNNASYDLLIKCFGKSKECFAETSQKGVISLMFQSITDAELALDNPGSLLEMQERYITKELLNGTSRMVEGYDPNHSFLFAIVIITREENDNNLWMCRQYRVGGPTP